MKQKILIIDDSKSDRGLLKAYIKKPRYDCTIIEGTNATEGLEIIENNDDIDCVFLDYMLPDMDGISLLKQIHDQESDLAPFPIVMLTGQGSEAVATDAIRYGAQDYLMKTNISPDTLNVAITKAQKFFELQSHYNQTKAALKECEDKHSQKAI